jgi:hypothetical protein
VLFYGGNQVERFPLSGLTYDTKARRLFVGDYQNNRVMVFDVATSTITNGENAENVLGQSDYVSGNPGISQNHH